MNCFNYVCKKCDMRCAVNTQQARALQPGTPQRDTGSILN
jgi:hypothetical protein